VPRQDASQPLDVGRRWHWPADDNDPGDLAVLVEAWSAPKCAVLMNGGNVRMLVIAASASLPSTTSQSPPRRLIWATAQSHALLSRRSSCSEPLPKV